MPKRWVAKACPLIVLARINHLFLLQHVAEELVVPAGVAQEIAQRPEDDSARQWLQAHGQELVREVHPPRVEVSEAVIP
jgi:predicted nucleic acid-binding protein